MTSNKSAAKNKAAQVDQSAVSKRLSSLLNRASVEAEKELNVVETLISKKLISRDEVHSIAAVCGAQYDASVACPLDVLDLIAVTAGANMRLLRVRHREEYLPVQTTKLRQADNSDPEVDALSCFMEVRLNGDGGVHFFPLSESNHSAVASGLFAARDRFGLLEFYPDYLAFFTLDSRLVFINRSRVENVLFHDPLTGTVECKPMPEGLVEAFYNYFEILDMCSHLDIKAAAPLMTTPLIKSVHRLVGENGDNLAKIVKDNQYLRPADTIDLLFTCSQIECYNVDHIDLEALDATLTCDGPDFVLSHILDTLTFEKHEVAVVTLPVFRCRHYANSLEITHYQSVQAASAIPVKKAR